MPERTWSTVQNGVGQRPPWLPMPHLRLLANYNIHHGDGQPCHICNAIKELIILEPKYCLYLSLTGGGFVSSPITIGSNESWLLKNSSLKKRKRKTLVMVQIWLFADRWVGWFSVRICCVPDVAITTQSLTGRQMSWFLSFIFQELWVLIYAGGDRFYQFGK